ncbi:MAG: FdtA/QdtA family cupin domain-containing protein [Acetatifactor sp.]|nr:FdtA/QdtA family cupin domain-containing protein [Acetatifactor sp.]
MQYQGPQMLEFQEMGDERGHLVVCEGEGRDIPFDIKRIFYIYGSDRGIVRGQHANKETEFVIINVAGSSKIKVLDRKGNEAVFILNRPRTGIYIPRMIWKEMYDFSEDSVLLCLASEHYNADEYIRNYEDFLKIVRENDEETD